jgi:hypothetical protein
MRPNLPADVKFSPFFAFLAKTHPKPPFWYVFLEPSSLLYQKITYYFPGYFVPY